MGDCMYSSNVVKHCKIIRYSLTLFLCTTQYKFYVAKCNPLRSASMLSLHSAASSLTTPFPLQQYKK